MAEEERSKAEEERSKAEETTKYATELEEQIWVLKARFGVQENA